MQVVAGANTTDLLGLDASSILPWLRQQLPLLDRQAGIWQGSFDDTPSLLERLMLTDLDVAEPPDGLLMSYALDVRYVEKLQPEIMSRFLYLTARAWECSLRNGSYASSLTAFVDALISRRSIVESTLGELADGAFVVGLSAFMLSSMANEERLEMDGGWLLHLGTLARLHLCIPSILERWEKFETAGLARCCVFLIALLKLESVQNPLLSTSRVPEPWAGFTEGTVPWRDENIKAVARWLEVSRVERQLARCALVLPESEQWFIQALSDAPSNVYEERLRELIVNAQSGAQAHWSDLYGARSE